MADFEPHKYETDEGNIFKIKCDDDAAVLAISGPEPTGTLTENMTVRITKSKNAFGIKPRYVLYKRPLGNPNAEGARFVTQGQAYRRIPVFQKSVWDGYDKSTAPSLTIGGIAFTYVDKYAESVK